jgi:hypothetical protein
MVTVAACGVSGPEGPEGSDPLEPPQERRRMRRGRKLEIAPLREGAVTSVLEGLIR